MAIPFAQLSFPDLYEQSLVAPLFRPWAELIVKDVDIAPADHVLDIACGTGIVARLAHQALAARVVGVDVSPAMLAVARRVASDVDWREGDAGALPLQTGEAFDVVLCQQGLQFFPDRAAAAREMHRALKTNGRLAVSTWRAEDEFPFLVELRRVAESYVGPIADRRHSFGDAQALQTLFRDAGFRDVSCKTVKNTIRFTDGTVFVRLNAMALVGMGALSKDLTDEERQQIVANIVADSADVVRPHTTAEGLAYELAANVLTARK